MTLLQEPGLGTDHCRLSANFLIAQRVEKRNQAAREELKVCALCTAKLGAGLDIAGSPAGRKLRRQK